MDIQPIEECDVKWVNQIPTHSGQTLRVCKVMVDDLYGRLLHRFYVSDQIEPDAIERWFLSRSNWTIPIKIKVSCPRGQTG